MNSSLPSGGGILSRLRHLQSFPDLDTFLDDGNVKASYRSELRDALTDSKMDLSDEFCDSIEEERNVPKAIYLISNQISLIMQKIPSGFIKDNREMFDIMNSLTDDTRNLLSSVKAMLECLSKHRSNPKRRGDIFQKQYNAMSYIISHDDKISHLNEWWEKVPVDRDTTRVLCANLMAMVDLLDHFVQTRLSKNINENVYDAVLDHYNLCFKSLNEIMPDTTITITQPQSHMTLKYFVLKSFPQFHYAALLLIIEEMKNLDSRIKDISSYTPDKDSIREMLEDYSIFAGEYHLYREKFLNLEEVSLPSTSSLYQLDGIYNELCDQITEGIRSLLIKLTTVRTFN